VLTQFFLNDCGILGSHGNYEFEPLPPGTYKLNANTADAAWAEEEKLTIILAVATPSRSVASREQPSRAASSPLQTNLLHACGWKQCSGQHLVSASVVADEDGRYELKGLTPGR
jgi:protocatechuate 3,4-dioxygenase beta subunit